MPSSHFTGRDARFVWALSGLQLISWGSVFYGFALFMAPLEQALGMTRAESSLGFSLMLLAEGLLAFPVGRWIDRGHERAVMTGASLLVGLAFWMHSQITTVPEFYAVWTLLGVGLAGTLYPPAFAVLTRRFPQHFRRAIITLTFLGGLASTVFIPLVAWLIDLLGWRDALCVLAAMHLLLCAPVHGLLLHHAPQRSMLASPHADSATLWRYVRQPKFWQLAMFVVLLMGVTSALPAHMVSLLRETGMAESWAIAVPASIGVLQVMGRLGLYVTEHRVDVHAANRWVTMLIPLGFLALLIGAGHGVWGVLFVVLYGLGNGMLTIVKGTVMAQYVSREHMGSLNGLLGLPIALARAAAPWLMGLLWSAEAGYTLGLWWMLGASVVGVASLWFAQKGHRL
jgi:predicted MFS family arabinose efflux permease